MIKYKRFEEHYKRRAAHSSASNNSNLSLTRTNFHFASSNFVYNFTLDNLNNVFRNVTSERIDIGYSPAGRFVLRKTVPEVLDTQDTWVLKTEGIVFPIRTNLGW